MILCYKDTNNNWYNLINLKKNTKKLSFMPKKCRYLEFFSYLCLKLYNKPKKYNAL